MKERIFKYIYGISIGTIILFIILTFNLVGADYTIQVSMNLIILNICVLSLRTIEDKYFNKKNDKKYAIYQIVSGFALLYIFLIVGFFYSYITIYIHEIGHVLAALSFDAEVLGIFLSPLKGGTDINIENLTDLQYTIIAATGPLGTIILGSFFLFLFNQDNNLEFNRYVPISFLILLQVVIDLDYIFQGAVNLIPEYDMTIILQLNPSLDRWGIAYWSLFGVVIICIYWFWMMFKKMRRLRSISSDHQVNIHTF